jgi:hypothetical protein
MARPRVQKKIERVLVPCVSQKQLYGCTWHKETLRLQHGPLPASQF